MPKPTDTGRERAQQLGDLQTSEPLAHALLVALAKDTQIGSRDALNALAVSYNIVAGVPRDS